MIVEAEEKIMAEKEEEWARQNNMLTDKKKN